MKKYAFLDFDGTLYNGFSINDFIKFLADKNKYDWAFDEEKDILSSYQSKTLSYEDATNRIFQLCGKVLKGKQVSGVKEVAREFWSTNNKIFPWAKEVIDILKNKDFVVYLASAAITVNVESAAEILGIDKFFSSEFTIVDGIYSGDIKDILHSHLKEKKIVDIVSSISPKPFTIGIGDSTGDVGMLSLMDKAFIVNPHQEEIIRIADENGWYIAKNGEELKDALNEL